MDEVIQRLTRVLEKLERRAEMPVQEWFSIKEAAVLTGLSQDHIRRAVTGGTLPCSNVGTPDRSIYRISRKDIELWMERRKAGAMPPPQKRKKGKEVVVSRHLGSVPVYSPLSA